eukprot:TRINITY_DN3106_c0_g1_i1.p1 TRINITY_DN3106_c0_g1~~TRINITY_DN3106_c0_g1_i1.p1  ORF type:complete len:378 (+),score=83.48 TRINITY_DN3106_c0_g1_i1:190-1323(+)
MKKFYHGSSGRSTPDSEDERQDSKARMNPALSSSMETIDFRFHRHPNSLEVINEEEDTSDTRSVKSSSSSQPPPYDIYTPPKGSVDKEQFAAYMLENVEHGDDMCTDPGCPYNRWLYSGASYPTVQYVDEWEQDRTRRHFDRIEEIIMSPKSTAGLPRPKLSKCLEEDGGNGSINSTHSYPVVTLPKSLRDSLLEHDHVESSICCFGSHKKSEDASPKGPEYSINTSSGLPPPPYDSLPPPPPRFTASHEMRNIESVCSDYTAIGDGGGARSVCSTCPTTSSSASTRSSCSCCASSEPEDPTAPHAFTMDMRKLAKAQAVAAKKRSKSKGVCAWVPSCNTACCATSTFIIFCLLGLTALLLYLKFHTNAMNEGMTAS